MAAVTVVRWRTNVAGARKHKTYTITGVDTNTLNTRLKRIESVSFSDVTITSAAVSGGIITFSATGAFTAVEVLVTGN